MDQQRGGCHGVGGSADPEFHPSSLNKKLHFNKQAGWCVFLDNWGYLFPAPGCPGEKGPGRPQCNRGQVFLPSGLGRPSLQDAVTPGTHPLFPGTMRVLADDGFQALPEDLAGILQVGEDS